MAETTQDVIKLAESYLANSLAVTLYEDHPDVIIRSLLDALAAAERERGEARAGERRIALEANDAFDAAEALDEFWDACGYPRNRGTLTPAEQIASIIRERDDAEDEAATYKAEAAASFLALRDERVAREAAEARAQAAEARVAVLEGRLTEAGDVVRGIADEFGCTVDEYHKNGCHWTLKDGTECFEVGVVLDREELIAAARALATKLEGHALAKIKETGGE